MIVERLTGWSRSWRFTLRKMISDVEYFRFLKKLPFASGYGYFATIALLAIVPGLLRLSLPGVLVARIPCFRGILPLERSVLPVPYQPPIPGLRHG